MLFLRYASLALLSFFLCVAPLVAGKLWPWQGLLVGLTSSLALLLWLAGGLFSPAKEIVLAKDTKRPAPSHIASFTETKISFCPDVCDIALGFFLIWQCLSWLVSVYRFATDVYLIKLFAGVIAFWIFRYGGFLPARIGKSKAHTTLWPLAVWALVGGGALVSLLGLREYVRTVFFLEQAHWRVFSTMLNPNVLAGYLLLTFFPTLALLLGWQSRRRKFHNLPQSAHPATAFSYTPDKKQAPQATKKKQTPATNSVKCEPPRYAEIAAFFAAILMLSTLLLTGSKAGLLALLAGLVIFALFGLSGKPKSQALMLGLVILLIVSAFIVPPLRLRLLQAFDAQSHSTMFRLYTWQATWEMIKARPWLGFGGGAYEHIFPRFAIAGYTRAAHQSFLQLAAETGIPGLMLGMLWGGLVLARLWTLARFAQGLSRHIAAAAFAALLGSALQELFDYPWHIPAVSFSFFAVAGIGLAPWQEIRQSLKSKEAPPEGASSIFCCCQKFFSARSRLLRGCGFAFGLILCIYCAKNLGAEWIAMRAQAAAESHALAYASMLYERAARWNPAQARFWIEISRIEEALALAGAENALPRAIQARLRALALQPTEPLNYLALARLYDRAGRLEDALAAAQAALQHYPRYPRGLAALGQLQEKAGQFEAAGRTYRQLVALQKGLVGQCAPIEGITETAFAWGWIGLGDEAQRKGHQTEALMHYGKAACLLEQAINEQMRFKEITGGEEIGLSHLAEDTSLAQQVLERLQRLNNPLSWKRQIRLYFALRREEDAKLLLEKLVRATPQTPADKMAQAWGFLKLAQQKQNEQQEDWRTLAKKGLHLIAAAKRQIAPQALPPGWLEEEGRALETLRQWAVSQLSERRP